MLLSRTKRFLFVKGLKVAGTSVEVHLADQLESEAVVTPIIPAGPPSHKPRNYRIDRKTEFYNHIPAAKIRQWIGQDEFASLTSWGLVRHPEQKVLSFFYMYRALKGPAYTLDDAITDCSSEADRYCDGCGRQLVTHILRYEEMGETLPPFLARFGLCGKGLSQVREKSGYRRQYDGAPPELTPAQKQRIRDKFVFEMQYYT